MQAPTKLDTQNAEQQLSEHAYTLSLEELRSYPGCAGLSEDEARLVIAALEALAELLYMYFDYSIPYEELAVKDDS